MTFEDILRQIIGGASRTVDTVGRATGNVLPEFNLSERGETYGAGAIAPADRVTRVQNDPRFGTNLQSSANKYYPNISQVPDQPSYIGNTQSVLSLTDENDPGGGGTGGTGGRADISDRTQDPGGLDELALAEQARRRRIESAKAQAGIERNNAQRAFDTILQAVNAFRDRSKTQFANAGQEITNRASEILGSNARTAREAAGEARARGRALGLGDSSKFNLQNKVTSNLASTQGNTVARRGEEERANQALYQERQDQAQTQENQANDYLRGANEKASLIEKSGYDAGDELFTNALRDIVNYQRSLAAINPLNAGGLTQYAPNFSGIVNTVNDVLNGVGGGGQNTAEQYANPVNPTDYISLLRRRGL